MSTELPADISGLIAAPYNPRTITDEALAGLTYSLVEFGDLSGIVWNATTGHIVAGHQRLRALRERFGDLPLSPDGLLLPTGSRFPVRVVEWDEGKEKAANVAANAPTISGTFTADLDALLRDVEAAMPEAWVGMSFEQMVAEVEPAGTVAVDTTEHGAPVKNYMNTVAGETAFWSVYDVAASVDRVSLVSLAEKIREKGKPEDVMPEMLAYLLESW
jgi:hypothetical protein